MPPVAPATTMRSLALPALVLTAAAAFTTLPPGWVIESTTTDLRSGTTSTSEMWVVGNSIKMTMTSGEMPQGDVNYLGDVGEIGELIYNNDEDRTFIRIDQQMMEEIGQQLGNVEAQMAEALAGIPESQRAAIMERMRSGGIPGMPGMDAMQPPTVELQATSERATHAGYPCVKYIMTVNGQATQHMWMTEWSNIEGGADMRGAFQRFSRFGEAMRDMLPQGGMFGNLNPMEGLDFGNRIPVVTIELSDSGEPVRETVITSVSQREIDASLIGPTEGYREQEMGPPGR